LSPGSAASGWWPPILRTGAIRDEGIAEVVDFLEANRGRYDDVLVSDRLPTPHMLLLFYGRVRI
jgi:putative protein kinase ArgK-like GTPase of G3E family